MNGTQRMLVLLIVVEMAGGGGLLAWRFARPKPPIPDLTGYNQYTKQQLLEFANQVDADSASDWAQLAEAYLANGFFLDSESCYRQAVAMEPGDSKLKYRFSLCLSAMGRMEEAKQQLYDALREGHMQPADCWYLIGRIWLREERIEEAREAFQRADEIPSARFELAKLLARSDQPADALPIVAQVETELPSVQQPHLLRAQVESMLGNEAKAEGFLDLSEVCSGQLPTPTNEFRRKILETLDEFAVMELVERAAELRDNRQSEQADVLLREAMGTSWNADVEDLRATLELDKGDMAAHQRKLEAIIERDGPDSYRLWRLGGALAASNQLEAAAQAFLDAANLNTDTRAIDSLEQLSMVYERLGDRKQANHFAARFRSAVGIQLFRQARLVEARATLQESVKMDDGNPHAWFYLAEIDRFTGNLPGAREQYDRCLELNPDHGRARVSRGRIAEE